MRVDQELLPIGHADLVENTRHVMPDRTVADRQLVGDVFVRKSLPHQADNFSFPLGQGVGPRRRLGFGFEWLLEGRPRPIPPAPLCFPWAWGCAGAYSASITASTTVGG